MKKEMVVARYNENIDWLKKITCVDKITIYNKGEYISNDYIKLKNINREAHTYFYHIVNNYDMLYDVTYFIQGNPFDHMKGIDEDNFNENLAAFLVPEEGKIPIFSKGYSYCTAITVDLYSDIFEDPIKGETAFSPGAQWAANRENIQSKSIEFYRKMLRELELVDRKFWNDGIYNAWAFESMWYYIFDRSIKEKKIPT